MSNDPIDGIKIEDAEQSDRTEIPFGDSAHPSRWVRNDL